MVKKGGELASEQTQNCGERISTWREDILLQSSSVAKVQIALTQLSYCCVALGLVVNEMTTFQCRGQGSTTLTLYSKELRKSVKVAELQHILEVMAGYSHYVLWPAQVLASGFQSFV
ncbi:hypothetical protein E2C01_006384 [Portunus trituberculatus]|uniref:Uncharacterized protein n=1 Tax=Portunus trituberculatus TaxID=210409 RepID=A0A5B7CY26_PORTR|nr:hypothetical protein [Portunus trituberculatus]